MIVQDLNFDQTVAMAKAKAESMIQNGLYSRFGLSEKDPIRIGPDRFPIPSLR